MKTAWQRGLNRLGWWLIHRGAGRVPVPRYAVVGQWLLWQSGAKYDHKGDKVRWSRRLED
jgi:hypothetical protein